MPKGGAGSAAMGPTDNFGGVMGAALGQRGQAPSRFGFNQAQPGQQGFGNMVGGGIAAPSQGFMQQNPLVQKPQLQLPQQEFQPQMGGPMGMNQGQLQYETNPALIRQREQIMQQQAPGQQIMQQQPGMGMQPLANGNMGMPGQQQMNPQFMQFLQMLNQMQMGNQGMMQPQPYGESYSAPMAQQQPFGTAINAPNQNQRIALRKSEE